MQIARRTGTHHLVPPLLWTKLREQRQQLAANQGGSEVLNSDGQLTAMPALTDIDKERQEQFSTDLFGWHRLQRRRKEVLRRPVVEVAKCFD